MDGQLEIRTFSLGREVLLPLLREVRLCRGTLLKMVPLAWPSTMVRYKASAGSVLISYVVRTWPGDITTLQAQISQQVCHSFHCAALFSVHCYVM